MEREAAEVAEAARIQAEAEKAEAERLITEQKAQREAWRLEQERKRAALEAEVHI